MCFNAITGRAQRKSVQQMEEENAKTGKLRQDIFPRRQVQTLYDAKRKDTSGYVCAAGSRRTGRTARRTQNKFTIGRSGRKRTYNAAHTAQQAASDNGGSEATTCWTAEAKKRLCWTAEAKKRLCWTAEVKKRHCSTAETAAQRHKEMTGFGETTLLTPEMEASFVQAKTNEKPEWNFVIKKEIMEIHTNEIV